MGRVGRVGPGTISFCPYVCVFHIHVVHRSIMLGFLRRHDLTTALAATEGRLTTVEAQTASAVMRAEELHEMTERLIKRYDARRQRSERDCDDDLEEIDVDNVSERVLARRNANRGLNVL